MEIKHIVEPLINKKMPRRSSGQDWPKNAFSPAQSSFEEPTGSRFNRTSREVSKLHKLPAVVPGKFTHIMEKEYEKLIDEGVVNNIRTGAGAAFGLVGEARKASGSIFENLGDIANFLGKSASSNPTAVTVAAVLGAAYSGILSTKNLIHSLQIIGNPKMDQRVSWIAHALQGVLQGGLAFGLAAPFLNMKSFFTQVIDGKAVVQTRMILGAILAPMLMGTGIKIAQNASVFNKLPLGIGPALAQIFGSISGATRELTTAPEYRPQNSPDQINPLAGAGIPAPTLAA